MRILAANLKLFYQCQGLWLWYLILLFYSFVVIFIVFIAGMPMPGRFVSYVLFSFLFGIIVADIQKDVLSKPFSFCMPNHKRFPRRLIFGMGSILNLPFGIMFFSYSGLKLPFMLKSLVILSASFAGMIVYLAAVRLSFMARTPAVMGVVGIFFMVPVFFGTNKALEYMIVSNPLHVTVAGTITCAFAWKWLGDESLARKYCGRILFGIADGLNLAKMQKYQKKRAAQMLAKRDSAISDRLEEFFVTRMEKHSPRDASRYVLGSLYTIADRVFGLPIHYVLPLIAIILLMGYWPIMPNVSNYIFIMPVFFCFQLDLIPHGGILLPDGRTEKYYTALILGFVITALSAILVTILAMLSVPLAEILPQITWKDRAFAYDAFDLRQWYFCPLLMPIALTVITLFPKKMWARFGIMMMAMYAWIFLGGFFDAWPTLLSLVGIPGIGGLIAVSWISFVLALGYHFRRRDLVSQSS
jgi:hypothetical protein